MTSWLDGGSPSARSLQASAPRISPRISFVAWLLALIGVLSRALYYGSNSSLSSDEAKLAINVLERSWHDLFLPLSYNQAAPPGFLVAQRLVSTLLGSSEWALRLVPFAATILSVALFIVVMRRILGPIGFLLAVVGFVGGEYVIAQAANAKQYGTDMLATLLLMNAYAKYSAGDKSRGSLLLLAATGALMVLLSQPALFMIVSISLALLWGSETRKDSSASRWMPRRGAILVVMAWCALSVTQYFLLIHPLRNNEFLKTYWAQTRGGYPDFQDSLGEGLAWFPGALADVLDNPAGIDMAPLAVVVLLLGTIVSYRRDRRQFVILGLPIACTLAAATIGKYPFADRLVFFLVPPMLGSIGVAIDFLCEKRALAVRASGYVAAALLFGRPAYDWVRRTCHRPPRSPSIGALLTRLESQIRPGDVLYARKNSGPTVLYYVNHRGRLGTHHYDIVLDDIYEPSATPITKPREITSQYIPLSAEDLFEIAGQKKTWVVLQVKRLFVEKAEDDPFLDECDDVATREATVTDFGVGAFAYRKDP